MISKYYRTIVWLIALIIILGLMVVIFVPRSHMQNSAPVAATSTASVATPVQPAMLTVTQTDNNTTVHLVRNEQFILNLGTLRWSVLFSPSGIIGRISSTTDNVGQGIYQALHSGTTTLHGTGAPICNPGKMCPDFLEAMTITFVVE